MRKIYSITVFIMFMVIYFITVDNVNINAEMQIDNGLVLYYNFDDREIVYDIGPYWSHLNNRNIITNEWDDDGDWEDNTPNGNGRDDGRPAIAADGPSESPAYSVLDGNDNDGDGVIDDGRPGVLVKGDYAEGYYWNWDREDLSYFDEDHDTDATELFGGVQQSGNSLFGRSMLFDGWDDCIAVNDFSNHPTTSFTIESYIYVEDYYRDPGLDEPEPYPEINHIDTLMGTVIEHSETDGFLTRIGIIEDENEIDEDRKICYESFTVGEGVGDGTGGNNLVSELEISLYQWNHIAFSFDDNLDIYSFYVNGVQDGPYSCTENPDWNPDWMCIYGLLGIGGSNWESVSSNPFGNEELLYEVYNSNFKGYIDEFKIYDEYMDLSNNIGILQANWPMKDGAGNEIMDKGNSNLHGSISGATWASDGPDGGSSLFLDGVDDKLTFPDPNIECSAFSLELWIKPTYDVTRTGQSMIISCRDSMDDWYGIKLNENNGYLYVEWDTGFTSTRPISWDEWNQIIVQYDGSTSIDSTKLFINGLLSGTMGGLPESRYITDEILIGEDDTGNNNYYGKVTGFRIYNYALLIDQMHSYCFDIDRTSYPDRQFGYDTNNFPNMVKQNIPYYSEGKYEDGSLSFTGSENTYQYCRITESIPSQGVDPTFITEKGVTIEAWIKPNSYHSGSNTPSYIINKWGNNQDGEYRLMIDDYDEAIGDGKVGFEIANSQQSQSKLVWTESLGNFIDQWHHVAATFIPGDPYGLIQICFDGVIVKQEATIISETESIQCLTPKSYSYNGRENIYIGCWRSPTETPLGPPNGNQFNGLICDVRISEYSRNFHEDTDFDSMSDQYEIMRSVFSDQYNPYIYNGRYALLVSAVEKDEELCWKFKTFMMRNYLLSIGWNDNDIIALTVSVEHGNSFRPYLDHGNMFNLDNNWIDGEAFKQNIKDSTYNTASSALINGGSYQLLQADGSWKDFHFYKPTINDIVFIKMTGHSVNPSVSSPDSTKRNNHVSYKLFDYPDYYSGVDNKVWMPNENRDLLESINSKYTVFLLEICWPGRADSGYCGWWDWLDTSAYDSTIDHQDGENRIVMTAAETTYDYSDKFCFYDFLKGVNRGPYLSTTLNIGSWFTPEEMNADGIFGTHGNQPDPYGTSTERYSLNDYHYNGIISVQEAFRFGQVVCNQKKSMQDLIQDPKWYIGESDDQIVGPNEYKGQINEVPNQLYL